MNTNGGITKISAAVPCSVATAVTVVAPYYYLNRIHTGVSSAIMYIRVYASCLPMSPVQSLGTNGRPAPGPGPNRILQLDDILRPIRFTASSRPPSPLPRRRTFN